MTRITDIEVYGIAVPPDGFGADARNPCTVYSAAVLEIVTDGGGTGTNAGIKGDSFVFTIGEGTREMCAVIEGVARRFLFGEATGTGQSGDWRSRELNVEELAEGGALGRFARAMLEESHYHWLGGAGMSRMAMGAVVNALWDLCAKSAGMTGWEFLARKSPAELVEFIDFMHIGDFLSPSDALGMLEAAQAGKEERIEGLYRRGPAAYNTAGWSAVPEEELVRKTREMVERGWPLIKVKVGAKFFSEGPGGGMAGAVEADVGRLVKVFDTIREMGGKMKVAVDCNQVFDVASAVKFITELAAGVDDAGKLHGAEYRLAWFEEPTSPISALGHLQVKRGMRERFRELGRGYLKVPVATGEHCPSPVVFKDMICGVTGVGGELEPIDIVQLDYSRMGGIGDHLAALLMARRAGVLVCPHAGGIGLCEGVVNVQALNEALFGRQAGAVLEYVEGGLHEGVYRWPARVEQGCYVLHRGAIGNGTALTEEGRAKYGIDSGTEWTKAENRDWAGRLRGNYEL